MCGGVLQHVRTVLWFLKQASLHDKAEHLLIGQTLVGLLCQSGNLPQHNPERPTQRKRARGINLLLHFHYHTPKTHRKGSHHVCLYLMCLLTRHQSWWWRLRPLETQVTSSGRGADLYLLFCSNPSHKCLWSCQSLLTHTDTHREKAKEWSIDNIFTNKKQNIKHLIRMKSWTKG